MSEVHLYLGVENLALNASQKLTLITAMRALGMDNQSWQPARRNHWRTRLDGDALILEAAFDSDNISAAAFITRLAGIFGVAENAITTTTTTPAYGTMIVFRYNAVNYLRVLIFGGLSATWAESGAQARAYIAANSAAWEGEV